MQAQLTNGTGVTERPQHWLPALPLAATIALLWPTLSQVMDVWLDDGTYSHGFLLLLVCAWLCWRQRQQIAEAPAVTWWPALVLTVLLAAGYTVALLAAVEVLQRLLIMPLLLAVTAAMVGPARARPLVFPAALLLLALPVWGLLIPLLQDMAVVVVSMLLDWQEIPARIDGNRIRIPAGQFEIAQGCSGLRYLLVSATFGLLWGHLYLRRRRHMLLFLGVALLVALLVNWIRIYLLILIGHRTEMQHALIQDHNNFGWYLFAIALLPLLWLGRSLPWKAAGDNKPTTAAPAARGTALPPGAMAILLSLLLLAPLPWRTSPEAAASFTLHPPLVNTPWQLQRPHPDSWQPSYQGLDRDWHLQYANGRRAYRLYLGWYNRQHAGAELYQRTNTLTSAGWTDAGALAPCPVGARCYVIEQQGQRHVVMRWHLLNRHLVTSRLEGKWHQLLAQFSGHPGAAILALETPCAGDCHIALEWLHGAASAVRANLLQQLMTTQESSS